MGDLVVQHARLPRRSPAPAPVPPDPILHINEEQKVVLNSLRLEWLALHNKLKTRAITHQATWLRINKAAGARTYHLIRKDCYNTAVAYVRQQIAILRGMKSAPRKDDDWRSKRFAAIKARCKNQLGNPDAYKPYINRFGASSLTELSTDQLQQTYAYIMAKKPA